MEASHQTEPLKEPRLPLELLIMIGEVLAGDLCFGSLANLNHTCRAGYAGTLSTLYDTMEMDERDLLGLKSDCAVRCEGWKYVKHLIVNKARDNLWTSGPLSNSAARQQLLPGLRFILFKGNKTTLFHPIEGPKYRPGPVHLVCIGSTRISTIVEVMLSTTEARDHYHRSSGRRGERRITQLFAKGDFVPDMICKITFEGSGRIHPDPGHRVHPQTRSVWRMICVEDVGIILTTTVIKDEGRELVHHLLAFLDVTCPATSLGDYYGDGWDTQFYCGIAVLPVLMSLGGLLPLWVTMGIEMYDDYTHPDLFREVFGEGIKGVPYHAKAIHRRTANYERSEIQHGDFVDQYVRQVKRWTTAYPQLHIQVKLSEPPREIALPPEHPRANEVRRNHSIYPIHLFASKGASRGETYEGAELVVKWYRDWVKDPDGAISRNHPVPVELFREGDTA